MQTQTMTELDMFRAGFEREYQTTLKLLRAYPAAQAELQPAPKLKKARELAFTLALVQGAVGYIVTNSELLGPPPFEIPATWGEVMGALEMQHADTTAKLAALDEAAFHAPFKMGAPKGEVITMRRADAMWFLANDHIHHRGQFSVYSRLAGATVPSIYGPSADEPWS